MFFNIFPDAPLESILGIHPHERNIGDRHCCISCISFVHAIQPTATHSHQPTTSIVVSIGWFNVVHYKANSMLSCHIGSRFLEAFCFRLMNKISKFSLFKLPAPSHIDKARTISTFSHQAAGNFPPTTEELVEIDQMRPTNGSLWFSYSTIWPPTFFLCMGLISLKTGEIQAWKNAK